MITVLRYGLLALFLIALNATAANGKPSAELRPLKGAIPAGDFYLKDMQGKRVRLGDFRGKVVLLNFWATWCSPCGKEMPAMERLYLTYGADGLVVVGVSVDKAAPGEVQAFVDRLQLTFPILHDRDSIVSRQYEVPGTPTSYLINREGKLAYRVLGGYDWFGAQARSAVEGLLQNRNADRQRRIAK